ncbi:fumarylacetoacetate hydrolase family protein [Streptomyces sp. PSKA54]|uniref:Fumarylacetoacetate hydrolase family protein n=1 Tax=Streptomyces himalayensis subsp. aureolus TaxID=2758039 RepID=A0A7W2CYB5_9ACTN|nr:fumarylacetoacetate hydrolase family protein [Streptomyces himalayensis]MBA4861206.1 fumarylacetoacetate hydrolase family protein [Streptomyces himalayensis subsp. aureolus]
MRLTTVRITSDRTAAARLDKHHIVLLPFPDVGAAIATGERWKEHAAAPGEPFAHQYAPADTAPLATGIATLTQVAVNYATRAKELDAARPDIPELLTTPIDHLVGHRDAICTPQASHIRWGVELCVVIGRETSHVPTDKALRHVAGYTAVNTIAAPGRPAVVSIGPQLVTPDELPPGARGLTLTASIDGRVRQKANTSELLFDVATVIAHTSTRTTLMPGDVITMGTPAGTTVDQLQDGSQLAVAIKGIGELHNTITRDGSHMHQRA